MPSHFRVTRSGWTTERDEQGKLEPPTITGTTPPSYPYTHPTPPLKPNGRLTTRARQHQPRNPRARLAPCLPEQHTPRGNRARHPILSLIRTMQLRCRVIPGGMQRGLLWTCRRRSLSSGHAEKLEGGVEGREGGQYPQGSVRGRSSFSSAARSEQQCARQGHQP